MIFRDFTLPATCSRAIRLRLLYHGSELGDGRDILDIHVEDSSWRGSMLASGGNRKMDG